MINKKVSIDDKLNLIYKYYQNIWFVSGDHRTEPPTPEQMKNAIKYCVFPGIEYVNIENIWYAARRYFHTLGDDNMETMDGDVDLRAEQAKINSKLWGVDPSQHTTVINRYAIENGAVIE